MANYTIELRKVLEETNLFDFDYTLNEKLTKTELEESFINKYFFREIGFETIGRFKHYLKTEWLANIGMLNQYLEKQKDIDPYLESQIESKTTSVFDDTPNTEITGAVDFASNITRHKNIVEGHTKTELELYNNYVDNLKNIKGDFLNKFKDLFMKIY